MVAGEVSGCIEYSVNIVVQGVCASTVSTVGDRCSGGLNFSVAALRLLARLHEFFRDLNRFLEEAVDYGFG